MGRMMSIVRVILSVAFVLSVTTVAWSVKLTDCKQLLKPGTYEVTDVVKFTENINVAKGVVLSFDGGMFYADGLVEIMGDETVIQAPDVMIFSKNIKVEGKWRMPYASPLWFEPSVEGDNSSSINKAAEMIGKGKVRLPIGEYNIREPIILPCGVTLEGVSGNSSSDDIKNKCNTEIIPNKNGNWRSNVNPSGYEFMVYVNATSAGAVREPWPTQWLAMRNIYMEKDSKILPDLRGVFAIGGAGFDYVSWNGFNQALCYDTCYYSDNKRITNCHFSNSVNSITAKNVRECYTLDMGFLGDGMLISHNHFVSAGHPAIYVTTCGGGIISDNIINGDVLVSGSNAFTFSSNHMEQGAQVKVLGSVATVSNNYFEKGGRPSVDISRKDHDYAVVSLSNNKYTVINRDRYNNETAEDKYERINNICEYDVKIDEFTILDVANEFRYEQVVGANKTLPFGISINTPNEGLKAFNDKSYMFSKRSSVVCDYGVQGTGRLNKINDVSVFHVQNVEWVTWFRPGGRYTYSYQVLPDIDRNIYGVNNGTVTNKAGGGTVLSLTEYGNGVLLGVKGGDTNLRLYRTCVDDGIMECVTIPIAGSRMLYDNGISVCGYKWQPVDCITEPEVKVRYESLELDGENVSAWCDGIPDLLYGWRVGDVLYNVGKSTEWNLKIVK